MTPTTVHQTQTMAWTKKDLLGLEELSREEIELVLKTAEAFKEISARAVKKVPTLRGKTVVNFFLEPSTRTRTSFELAAKRLSADVLNITSSGSSMEKGETLMDTIRNIEAMKVDVIVMRHGASGACHFLARRVASNVINAGDGSHEHPTQALVDLFTMREKKGRIDGLNVSIIGDIAHSRVARSDIWGLTKLGAEVTVCGPATLMPQGIESLGVRVTHKIEEALGGADVINVLRIQLERQRKNLVPSVREYALEFGLTKERVALATPGVVIMHPGPVNRDIEMTSEVADSASSVILEQVTNGIAVRMAVLYLVAGTKEEPGSL